MLTALLFAAMVQTRQVSPFQIVPASQFPFDRKQAILDSGEHDPVGAFLVNDNGVSDKAYEAIVQNPDCIKVVKLVRKESSGLSAWTPDGKPLPTPTEIDAKFIADFEPGDVGMELTLPFIATYGNSAADKPGIALTLGTAKKSTIVPGPGPTVLQKIGMATGKFANIRFSVRVSQFVTKVPKETGLTKTFDDVTYTITGPIASTTDKLEHLEVVQRGVPSLGSFSLMPGIDWNSYEKDHSVGNRRMQGGAKLIKPDNGTPPQDELHYDIRSNIPVRYWSGINVYRNSTVQGYFGHVAMQPQG